jgi:hypothetical protein
MSTAQIPHAASPPSRTPPADPWRPMTRRRVRRLIRYLLRAGGSDIQCFVDQDGNPDVQAAHSFAEQLRVQLGPFRDDLVQVIEWEHIVQLDIDLPPFV